MRWQRSRHLLPAFILACTVWASAQVPTQTPDEINPRHFDAWYIGSAVVLGPDWLFSAGDNPAYASPGYDDSSWKTVSLQQPVESYAPGNTHFGWYRIHILDQLNLRRQLSMNTLAVST
jgi:hypothetical protein